MKKFEKLMLEKLDTLISVARHTDAYVTACDSLLKSIRHELSAQTAWLKAPEEEDKTIELLNTLIEQTGFDGSSGKLSVIINKLTELLTRPALTQTYKEYVPVYPQYVNIPSVQPPFIPYCQPIANTAPCSTVTTNEVKKTK